MANKTFVYNTSSILHTMDLNDHSHNFKSFYFNFMVNLESVRFPGFFVMMKFVPEFLLKPIFCR